MTKQQADKHEDITNLICELEDVLSAYRLDPADVPEELRLSDHATSAIQHTINELMAELPDGDQDDED